MKKKGMKFLGIASILFGIVLILSSSINITGFVVSENAKGGFGYLLSALFILGGVLLWKVGRKIENNSKKATSKVKLEIGKELENERTGSDKDILEYAQQLGYDIRIFRDCFEIFKEERKVAEISRDKWDHDKDYRNVLAKLYKSIN